MLNKKSHVSLYQLHINYHWGTKNSWQVGVSEVIIIENLLKICYLSVVFLTSVVSEIGDWTGHRFSCCIVSYVSFNLKLNILARMYLFFVSKINTHCEWLVAVQRPWRVLNYHGLLTISYPSGAILSMHQLNNYVFVYGKYLTLWKC